MANITDEQLRRIKIRSLAKTQRTIYELFPSIREADRKRYEAAKLRKAAASAS